MLYDPISEANTTGVNIVGNLGPGSLKLQPSYKFDGTHIHPNYVPLLLEPFMRTKLN